MTTLQIILISAWILVGFFTWVMACIRSGQIDLVDILFLPSVCFFGPISLISYLAMNGPGFVIWKNK